MVHRTPAAATVVISTLRQQIRRSNQQRNRSAHTLTEPGRGRTIDYLPIPIGRWHRDERQRSLTSEPFRGPLPRRGLRWLPSNQPEGSAQPPQPPWISATLHGSRAWFVPAVRTRCPVGLVSITDYGQAGRDGRARVAALLLTADFHDYLGRSMAAEVPTAT